MRTAWIIWYVMLLHFWWGVTLLTIGPVGMDYHGGVSWNPYILLGSPMLWGWLMILGATSSMTSMCWRVPGVITLMLLLPQQVVLAIGALGNVGHLFGIGYEYELSRILRVMPLSLGAFVFHTFAITHLHSGGIWKRQR